MWHQRLYENINAMIFGPYHADSELWMSDHGDNYD